MQLSLPRHSAKLVAISLLLTLPALAAMAAEGPPRTISTVAGNGQRGFGGDCGPATAALLAVPHGVAPLPSGGYLVADTANNRVRRVNAQGVITTVAGNGSAGFSGDGGPATAAQLDGPTDVSFRPGGGFLVADSRNGRIRRVAPNGSISTPAGNGRVVDGPLGGDGGLARATHLDVPEAVAATGDGFLVADTGHHRIRKVGFDGKIATVAGIGVAAFAGDGGSATSAALSSPYDVTPTHGGGFLIADTGNNRVRKVSPQGNIDTAADGLNAPQGVADTPGGGFLIADTGNNRIRKVSPQGNIDTAADGLNGPQGVVATPGGGFLIADTGSDRVRRVNPDGKVSILAGNGAGGYNGDGRAPLSARLNGPVDVAVLAPGRFLIADTRNQRIRLVQPSAGKGGAQGGDGGAKSLAAPAKPRLGKRFNVRSRRGRVRVRIPGSRRSVPLGQAASVPMGSVIDATGGTAQLTVARDRHGATQSGSFWSGSFVVFQTHGRRPVTELRLRGGDLAGCAAGHSARTLVTAAGRPRGRKLRKLWSHVKGRFRTRGRHGAATVRGTKWLTEDDCGGTLVAVRQGLVAVRDFTRRKTFMVPAGRRHFSPARRRAR